MRSFGIVVDAPTFDYSASLGEAVKDLLIQAFVSKASVEALDECILRRLSRCNIVPFDASSTCPLQSRSRSQLGTIVGNQHQWYATPSDESVELAHDPFATDRSIDDQSQRFSREIIDDAQYPETPTPIDRIGYEVEAPSLIRALRDGQGCPGSCCPLAATSTSNRQLLFSIEPKQFLVIENEPFLLEEQAEPSVAEPPTFSRENAQPLTHLWRIRLRHTPNRLGIDFDQPAGAPMRVAALH
jgi:hypothetical protein